NGEPRHGAAERSAEVAHRSDPDHLGPVDRERHDALASGVAVEPPPELVVGELRRADAREQGDEVGAPVRRVAHGRKSHRVAVPRAMLSARRACVPTTVSLTAIRSQAPRRTSSNVRAGYGSML